MSVLVKGMEMPENCCQCIHTVWDGRDDVCRFSGISALSIGRQYNCPLIEVPEPHGRLIDADELIEKQKEDAEIFMGSTNYGDKVRYDEAMNAVANIVNAPTVIPADKDGET